MNRYRFISHLLCINALLFPPLAISQPRQSETVIPQVDFGFQTIREGPVNSVQIPRVSQLRFVMNDVLARHTYGNEYLPFSESDYNAMEAATSQQNYINSSYSFLKSACEDTANGKNSNAEQLGELLANSDKLEVDAMGEFYRSVYENLTADGKSFIENALLNYGSANRVKIIETDYGSMVREDPSRVFVLFKSMCENLDNAYEALSGPGGVRKITLGEQR